MMFTHLLYVSIHYRMEINAWQNYENRKLNAKQSDKEAENQGIKLSRWMTKAILEMILICE